VLVTAHVLIWAVKMGNPFSLFVKTKKLEIGIYGLDNAGKTTIFNHIKRAFVMKPGEAPAHTLPTIEFDARNVQLHNKDVTMWDMAGQKEYRLKWAAWLLGRDAIIYVIDMNDVERFRESVLELNKLLHANGGSGAARYFVCGKPFLILLNKMDMYRSRFAINPNAFSISEIDFTGAFVPGTRVYFDESYASHAIDIVFRTANAKRSTPDANTYSVYACSALKCENLEMPTKWLVDAIRRRNTWWFLS